MDAEQKNSSWNRRTFLSMLGMGTLSWAGLSLLSPAQPTAIAAGPPRRFVYTWTAFDILDPHVKDDTNATFFTLNMVEQADRAGFYEQACRLIVDDAPDIWGYGRLEYPPLSRQIQGFEFCPVGLGRDFWPLYFDAQA